MKKFDDKTALAKIKVLMNNFYENVGREEFEDLEEEQKILIGEIDEILHDTDISTKHLIMEQFKKDKE